MMYAAFMMGIIGSLHCLGMCGPIAFALPVRTNNRWLKVLKYLLYNTGRVLTYAVLGLIVGTVGKGFAMAGLQQVLSVATGALIILSVIVVYNPFKNVLLTSTMSPLKQKLKSAFHFYFQNTNWYSLFILGVLNGLLPCGMVYAAMVGAMSAGSSLTGAAFMIAFGLGTLPMMMTIALGKNAMSLRLKQFFYNVTPVVACALGALLIIRGLNLDIPFVSPSVSGGEVHSCH